MRAVLIACVLSSVVACATSAPSGGNIDAAHGGDDGDAIDASGGAPSRI
jgi:hypothetical protein